MSEILKNRVYAGSMVQGRQRVVSYKVHQRQAVPQEEWFVVPGTHPPIVELEVFQRVQALASRPVRTPPGQGTPDLWSGLLFCARCGRALKRKTAKGYAYYACRAYAKEETERCAGVSIRADRLSAAVLALLQGQINRLEARGELAEELDRQAIAAETDPLSQLRMGQEREREQLLTVLDELYVDWKRGAVTEEANRRIRARVKGKLDQLEKSLENLNQMEQAEEKNICLEDWLAHHTLLHLERGVLLALVERILVGSGGGVELYFRFRDPVNTD